MPEIYEGLKRNFPSLSDDDAMKAAQTIAQTVPDLPQSQEYIDPGNSNPSPSSLSSMIEPKIEPDVPPKPIDMIRSLADPERFAKASADYEKYTSSSPGSVAAGIMQWFPRLRQFSGRINDSRNRNAKTAQYEMGKSLEAMKMLQGQENFDREQALRDAEGKRKEIEFKELHPEEANAMDSAMTQAARGLVSNMMTKAGMGKLADVANQMNFNQLKLTSEKFGLGNQFDQEMQNYRARLSADTSNRSTEARERGTQAKIALTRPKQSVAEETRDKVIGKKYAEDTVMGGFANDEAAIKQAAGIIAALKDPNTAESGGISGMLPKSARDYTNRESAKLEDQARTIVLPLVKKYFPGATSNWESQTALELVWNPRMSNADNAQRMQTWLDKAKTEMNNRKSQYNKTFGEGTVPVQKSAAEMTDEEVMEAAKAKGWIK